MLAVLFVHLPLHIDGVTRGLGGGSSKEEGEREIHKEDKEENKASRR